LKAWRSVAQRGAAWRCKNTSTLMQICHHEAATLCKSGEPFLHQELPLFENRNNTMVDFKNLAYLI
jgi:hypothetical protein